MAVDGGGGGGCGGHVGRRGCRGHMEDTGAAPDGGCWRLQGEREEVGGVRRVTKTALPPNFSNDTFTYREF
ncbi:hypothetical protein TIFTF001_026748 [Ficus carica]|uniref:Uncharacterized protein n=1 Tax=Ficus carica TaxID=3494 RepID=A0AA88DLN2_FICCA|nr:hypothetical protein TIFTF001_026748 [Ficus carica]